MKYSLVVFHNIHEAMDFENRAMSIGLSGRLIPLPPIIDSGCGMVWREPTHNKEVLKEYLESVSYLKVVEMEQDEF